MKTDASRLHGERAWIAQHHAQLERHVAQCWTRRSLLTATQCLDAVHEQLGHRFATTVFAAVGVIGLLARWG